MVRISVKLVRDRLTASGLVRSEVDKGVAGGVPGAPAPLISEIAG